MTSITAGSVKINIDPKTIVKVSASKIHNEGEERSMKIINDAKTKITSDAQRQALVNPTHVEWDIREARFYSFMPSAFRFCLYAILFLLLSLIVFLISKSFVLALQDIMLIPIIKSDANMDWLLTFFNTVSAAVIFTLGTIRQVLFDNCIWLWTHHKFLGFLYTSLIWSELFWIFDHILTMDNDNTKYYVNFKTWKQHQFKKWIKDDLSSMFPIFFAMVISLATAYLYLKDNILISALLVVIKEVGIYFFWDVFNDIWNYSLFWGIIYSAFLLSVVNLIWNALWSPLGVIPMSNGFLGNLSNSSSSSSSQSDRVDFWGRVNHLELFNIEKAITKLGNKK